MNEGFVTARYAAAPPAISSSIFREAVTRPARSAQAVPRPSAEIPTTRLTPCFLNAATAGRVKPTYASSTLWARGFGGTSQKTASAPAKARSRTSGWQCDPGTTSARSRTELGTFDRSRAINRAGSDARRMCSTTCRPIAPVGVVMTIMTVLPSRFSLPSSHYGAPGGPWRTLTQNGKHARRYASRGRSFGDGWGGAVPVHFMAWGAFNLTVNGSSYSRQSPAV